MNRFEIEIGVLDLNEFERNDDEGLGGSENSAESSETREGAFAVGTTLTPLRNRSGRRAAGSSWLLQRVRGKSCPRNHLQRSKEISPGAPKKTLARTIWSRAWELRATEEERDLGVIQHVSWTGLGARSKRAKPDLGTTVQTCRPT